MDHELIKILKSAAPSCEALRAFGTAQAILSTAVRTAQLMSLFGSIYSAYESRAANYQQLPAELRHATQLEF